MVVMKIGNSMPRAGIMPTSLAFCTSVLPLDHIDLLDVTTVPTPTYLYSPTDYEVSAAYYM